MHVEQEEESETGHKAKENDKKGHEKDIPRFEGSSK